MDTAKLAKFGMGLLIMIVVVVVGYIYFFQNHKNSNSKNTNDLVRALVKEKVEACSEMVTSTYKAKSIGVYYKSEEGGCWQVERADPNTFEILTHGFAKDAHKVFYIGSHRVPDRDVSTFVVLSDLYSKDKNDVFVNAYHDIEGEDAATFEVIEGTSYAKDKNFVYNSELVTEYGSNGVIKGADPQTFVLLGGGYTKDKSRVYLNGRVIPDADSVTAIRMDNKCGILKASKHIFYGLTVVSDADPESFDDLPIKPAPDCTFFTDAENVFISQEGYNEKVFRIIKNAHKDSLRFIATTTIQSEYSTIYARPYGGFSNIFTHFITADKDHVFFDVTSILGADPATYVVLNECYAKDKNRVYYGGLLPMSNVDLQSFKVAMPQDDQKPCQAEDKNFLYIDEKPMLPNRDNPEFLFPPSFGKTSKNVYYMGLQIVGADPNSFRFIVPEPNGKYSYYTSDIYSADKQYVYYGEKRVLGADPATFKLTEGLGTYHAIDKNGKYLNGVKIKDDFKFCSTDPNRLPQGKSYWDKKLNLDVSSTTYRFEFCQMSDGGTLVGYKESELETKTIKLFDSSNQSVGSFSLDCPESMEGGFGGYVSEQSFQALVGNKVILSCIVGEACTSYTVNEFDLTQLKTTSSGLSAKKVDGPFDCGYRG